MKTIKLIGKMNRDRRSISNAIRLAENPFSNGGKIHRHIWFHIVCRLESLRFVDGIVDVVVVCLQLVLLLLLVLELILLISPSCTML